MVKPIQFFKFKSQVSFLKKTYNISANIFFIFFILISVSSGCRKDEMSEEEIRESITHQLTGAISADTLETMVKWMENMGTRFALADNHRNVAINIRNRFRSMGYSDVRTDSFQISRVYQGTTYQQWQYNVIASINGRVNPDSICVIGAHYDNNLRIGNPFDITPGANDNASGVAATLEIARVMKKYKYSPKNTIEFVAFGSEELGLYGSFAYTSKATLNSKKIKLMLNNDMIAFQPGVNRAEWIVNIIDYDNSHPLRGRAEAMCTRYTGLKYKNDNTYSKQSDSYPFFLSGYPAIFFFSNVMDNNYHTLNDLASNCNFDYCREVVNLNCAILVGNN